MWASLGRGVGCDGERASYGKTAVEQRKSRSKTGNVRQERAKKICECTKKEGSEPV